VLEIGSDRKRAGVSADAHFREGLAAWRKRRRNTFAILCAGLILPPAIAWVAAPEPWSTIAVFIAGLFVGMFVLAWAIAAAITTLAWLVAFGQRWLLVTAVAGGAVLALVPLIKVGVFLLPIFVVPAFLLLFLPWQAAAAVFVGVAVAGLAFRPSRERLALHLVALYVAFCAQAIFTALSVSIARGTFS
jgi:hypothetical protein